ncbi:MAG TPA: maleylpyruvate isomerase N-terminal domain-containing protein [Nocardioidaceae bacterium]|nr:maleylpyruvate isomerase N-terminal domain-containing protein [Nocardioidaceae bacterium]
MRVTARSTTSLDLVEEYVAAAGRFEAGVARSDLRAPVPACPTWSTYDLVVHLGNVHAWAATIVETGARAAPQNDEPRSRRPRSVGEWYAGKAEDLYQVLRAADLDAPCWNFAGSGDSARFWARRQTHETLMHLLDLDQASRRTTDVAALVCTDGIAEVLEVFLPRMHARGHAAVLTAPLTLRAVDTDHVWTLTPRTDAPPLVAVRTEPGADLVEGSACALWRLLWKRAPAPGSGSPAVGTQRRSASLAPAEVSFVGNAERIAAFIGSRLTP